MVLLPRLCTVCFFTVLRAMADECLAEGEKVIGGWRILVDLRVYILLLLAGVG